MEREVMPGLPTSGQIIGALVTRLGIRHPVLQHRNARRYFAADPERLVKDSTKAEIIDALAEVLTDAGFVSSPPERESKHQSAPALSSMLQWHTDHWDLMRSGTRRRTVGVEPSHLPKVWEAYVRLAVIDLALRVAAHLHLVGASPEALELLNSVSVDTRGDFLNQKRRQTSLTLEDLAEALDVTDHTVDAWLYDGTRPSNDNLTKLAGTLAERIEGSDAASVGLELRALYWVSDVAALLAEHIGAAAVAEIVGRLHKYAEEAYCIIDDQFPAEDRAADLTVLADLGVGARVATPLLSGLIGRESDGEWREDLRSIGLRWMNRVISVNMRARLAEEDELIQETEGRLLEDWDVSNPQAYAHYRRSFELQMQGKPHEALSEVEIAARLDPMDPANHFTLGSVKTSIGIARGDVDLVDEGLAALWLAVTLDPHWLPPWAEIGSTLYYTDRPEEAVAHLRSVKPECGPLDSYCYSTLGTAEWKLDELPRALAAFEAALELDPEETSVLLAASELALLIGDGKKHRRYLRRAQHFGADEGTLRFWAMLREFGEKYHGNAGPDEYDRKIAVMDAVIRLSPDDDYAHVTRSLAHFAKGNDDLAIADMDAVLQLDPDHAAAHMLRGTLFGYREQWNRMVADMTEVIRLRPADAQAHYQRGAAYGEQDLFDQAVADLCEAVRLEPDHADAHRVLGDCLRHKGDYDTAIADFGTALRLDPENTAAYLGRGAAHRMKGDLTQAIADYDAAVHLKPEEPLAYRFRGDARVAKGEYDLAIADCNRALQLSAHDPIAHLTRGNAHLFSGELEPALADFNAAVELDPTSGRYTYGRGLARLLLGDEDGAEKDFQLARELGYDDQDPKCEE